MPPAAVQRRPASALAAGNWAYLFAVRPFLKGLEAFHFISLAYTTLRAVSCPGRFRLLLLLEMRCLA